MIIQFSLLHETEPIIQAARLKNVLQAQYILKKTKPKNPTKSVF